eukprot:scaffold7078_cov56-Phaeocystis_antarctica.AAC.3
MECPCCKRSTVDSPQVSALAQPQDVAWVTGRESSSYVKFELDKTEVWAVVVLRFVDFSFGLSKLVNALLLDTGG